MTERGGKDTEKDDEMAAMNYRNFDNEEDAGHNSDDSRNPAVDGGNALHAVNVEPSVEMASGHSTGRGPRKLRGRVMVKNVGCSKLMAVCLLLLILGSILMIAIVASFARPRCILSSNNTETTPAPAKSGPVLGDDGKLFGWQDIRLPTDVKPLNYTIDLHPNLTSPYQVLGQVQFTLNVTKSTDFIVFHATEMNITKPSKVFEEKKPGSGREQNSINVVKMQRTKKNEQVYLKLASSMKKGLKYILTLKFNYTLADGLDGFYRSTYKAGNEKR